MALTSNGQLFGWGWNKVHDIFCIIKTRNNEVETLLACVW